MLVVYWKNDTCGGSQKILSWFHFAHNKSHKEWPGLNSNRLVTNCLSHGMYILTYLLTYSLTYLLTHLLSYSLTHCMEQSPS